MISVPKFKDWGSVSVMVYYEKYNIILDCDWSNFYNRILTDTSSCINYNDAKNNNSIFLCELPEFAINKKIIQNHYPAFTYDRHCS